MLRIFSCWPEDLTAEQLDETADLMMVELPDYLFVGV